MSCVIDYARVYLSRGWRTIPVPFRGKAPKLTGWPALRLGEADLAQHFNGQPSNIGTLLGEPSGGLVDADIDCAEALRLAARLLPTTHSVFGRASKRRSHRLYYAEPLVPTERFEDLDGVSLVELRSTGAQTVFPGSVHEEASQSNGPRAGAPSSAPVRGFVRPWPSLPPPVFSRGTGP